MGNSNLWGIWGILTYGEFPLEFHLWEIVRAGEFHRIVRRQQQKRARAVLHQQGKGRAALCYPTGTAANF
jgi:hypothetical protein